jgi:hypothetical protein
MATFNIVAVSSCKIEQWVRKYERAIVVTLRLQGAADVATRRYDPAGIDHQDHIAVARAVLNIAHRKPEIELLLQVEASRQSAVAAALVAELVSAAAAP